MTYDATRICTEQLLKSWRFHDRDLTRTMEEECRRLYFMQEIGAELRKRGVAH